MQPWSHMIAHVAHTRREAIPLLGAVVALAAPGVWSLVRRRPTAEEIEAGRRAHLALHGRTTVGSLLDVRPGLGEPRTLVYRYRIAGVTYECAQDVSPFAPTLDLSAFRLPPLDLPPLDLPALDLPPLDLPVLDLPVQVRYDRANPGDSIVLAEGWSGLWSQQRRPAADSATPQRPLPRMEHR